MSEEALSTEEIEAPSMDDTIRATLDEINSRTEEEPAAEPKEERARDEHGKFVAKESVSQEAETETQVTEQPIDETQQEPIVPPELQKLGLRKDEAEAFSKADPAVQQAFIRRSEEMHKGFEQNREKAQFGDAMLQAINPHLQTIQSLGVHPAVAVSKLLEADHALRFGNAQQKTAFITQLARDYGVDLGQAQEYAAATPHNPEVEQLRAQLAQMQQTINQREQSQQLQQQETLNSEIARFAADPNHKHFEEVREYMAGLLQTGIAPDLEKAYDMAVYANPNVRAKVLAEQQAQAEAKRQAELTAKANEARKAAAVNLPRKGVVASAKAVGTMDDTIRETAARLGLIQ